MAEILASQQAFQAEMIAIKEGERVSRLIAGAREEEERTTARSGIAAPRRG